MLTADQQQAAQAPHSVAVLAGAGTGKTHMLSARYLYHLTEFGLSPLELVAVTFTRKAAEELRSRIRQDLSTQLQQNPIAFQTLFDRWPGCDVLADLEAAPVSTFHALAGQICREQSHHLGLSPNFVIQEEWEAMLWKKEQLDLLMDRLPQAFYEKIPYSTLRQVLEHLIDDRYTASHAIQTNTDFRKTKIQQWRQTALNDLISSERWMATKDILAGCAGRPGDAAEENRVKLLELMELIEADQEVEHWTSWVKAISFKSRGQRKNWPSAEILDEVRSALKVVRSLIQDHCEAGTITTIWSAVDEAFEAKLSVVYEAYQQVRSSLDEAKKQARLMDFSDLEWYALEAMKLPEVQAYYRRRWQAFLVDEFQDTNPVQSELLTYLKHDRAKMTIVGDGKQSIYRFRRAEVGLFYAWCKRLETEGDQVTLSQSFRTHRELVAACNQLCEPLLNQLHQPLQADRTEPVIDRPLTLLEVAASDPDQNAVARRVAEAQAIAQRLRHWVETGVQVFDKPSRQPRPIAYRDMAILGRSHKLLGLMARELTAAGLPVNLCSGDLLDTREAQDAAALLRVLADRQDSAALVTLLRSPWFAVSDRALWSISRRFPPEPTPTEDAPAPVNRRPPDWWAAWESLMGDDRALAGLEPDDRAGLQRAWDRLRQWRGDCRRMAPSELLHRADRATGYSATIANLPDGDRRQRDWRDFADLIAGLERGAGDTFGTVRRLRRIETARRAKPGTVQDFFGRSPLEAGDAIDLMTIHASKGLEWPLVVLPDLLTEREGGRTSDLLFSAELGVAFRWRDPVDREWQTPALLKLLQSENRRAERDESRRLFYVALTRSRDRLLLSANLSAKQAETIDDPDDPEEPASERFRAWELVRSVAQERGWPIDRVAIDPLTPADRPAAPIPPTAKPTSDTPLLDLLWGRVSSGLDELPVTALSEYARCPRRFEWRIVDDRPPAGDKPARSRRVGTLVHRAIERQITDAATLAAHDDTLDPEAIAEALALANRVWTEPAYGILRDDPTGRYEVPVTYDLVLPDGGVLRLNGIADWVGAAGIVDFKTDRDRVPEEHGLQLWAYAAALGGDRAALAYLRHPDQPLTWFDRDQLAALEPQAIAVAQRIRSGDFAPTPSDRACGFCPYQDLCDRAVHN
jgi:ATP-dependent helicase/nuclease subunit A